MSMEKITKEELKNLFGGKALSDDELEKVSGGGDNRCKQEVDVDYDNCKLHADNKYNTGKISYNEFIQFNRICKIDYEAGMAACG